MNRVQAREKEPTVYDACRKGDISRVEQYVNGGGSVTDCDDQKMTMLHHACFGGHMRVVQTLLSVLEKQTIDFDATDVGGWTPLHYAADKNHAEIAALLLNEGANVNCKDEMKKTPLHLAAANGHLEMVDALLQHGAMRQAKSVSGWDAAKYAEENQHAAIVERLKAK